MGPKRKTSKQNRTCRSKLDSTSDVEEPEVIYMQNALNRGRLHKGELSAYSKAEESETASEDEDLEQKHKGEHKCSKFLLFHHLQNWINEYEEAKVNVYTPKLCHEIIKGKAKKVPTDIRSQYVKEEIIRCRVRHINANVKMIVASRNLQTNQPVIELKGKYMLPYECILDEPSCSFSETSEVLEGPFIFLYEIWEQGLVVCVDTRTYGNDARFVRRSCKPNAQIKHCFKQELIHLYIVATKPIERNCEITIAHKPGQSCNCNQLPNVSENVSEPVIKRAKKTTVLRDDSGVAAELITIDDISEQPISPLPGTSGLQQRTFHVKNKKRKGAKRATRQSIPKTLPQQKLNSKAIKKSTQPRTSFSTNEERIVAKRATNLPSTKVSASKVINSNRRQHRDISERDEVILVHDHAMERQHSEAERSGALSDECQQKNYVERDIHTNTINKRQCAMEKNCSVSCQFMHDGQPGVNLGTCTPCGNVPCQFMRDGQPDVNVAPCVQRGTAVPLPTNTGASELPQICRGNNDFWSGVTVGLCAPVYQLCHVLQVMGNKANKECTCQGYQTNRGVTYSMPEAGNEYTGAYGVRRSDVNIQCDFEDMSREDYCPMRSDHLVSHDDSLVMGNKANKVYICPGYQTNHGVTYSVPEAGNEYTGAYGVRRCDVNLQCDLEDMSREDYCPMRSDHLVSHDDSLVTQCAQYYNRGAVCGGLETQYGNQPPQCYSTGAVCGGSKRQYEPNQLQKASLMPVQNYTQQPEVELEVVVVDPRVENGNMRSSSNGVKKLQQQALASTSAGSGGTAVGSSQDNSKACAKINQEVNEWLERVFGKSSCDARYTGDSDEEDGNFSDSDEEDGN